MDSFGELVAGEYRVDLAEKAFYARPLELRDIGTLKNLCFQSRPDPLEEIKPHLDGLPREVACHAWDKALAERRAMGTAKDVPMSELTEWMTNEGGYVDVLWLALGHRLDHKFDRDSFAEWVNPLRDKSVVTFDQIAAAILRIMQASGFITDTNPTDPAMELELEGEVTINSASGNGESDSGK